MSFGTQTGVETPPAPGKNRGRTEKMICKLMKKADNHGKDPSRSWAFNHMGNLGQNKTRQEILTKMKIMPNVYVILGDSNTRKSSTMRALTGVRQESDSWEMATGAKGVDIFYIRTMSLQEAGITPQVFVKTINQLVVSNIFISLRIKPSKRAFKIYPAGVDYLDAFKRAKWNIKPLFVLGDPALPPGLPTGIRAHLISNSRALPANEIASRIRGLWNWK